MSSSLPSQLADVAPLTIHHNDHPVGLLIADNQPADGFDKRQSYRFTALDRHFILLDGSRFPTANHVYAAIARLSRFVDRPLAANEA
ncbi:MAG TPA: hypothetical protein VM659_10890 [Dongiaceae bacterium]|nr:hypothetical protein [Dongiaceae bacterium]